MIKTFRCVDTESLFNGARVRRFVNIEAVARRKLENGGGGQETGRLTEPRRATGWKR